MFIVVPVVGRQFMICVDCDPTVWSTKLIRLTFVSVILVQKNSSEVQTVLYSSLYMYSFHGERRTL